MDGETNRTAVRAETAVLDVFPSTAEVRRGPDDGRADLIVNGQAFEIKWIGDGRLADVRRMLQDASSTERLIAVARHLSPGARDALAQERVGWVDETGAAEIAVGSIVVSRTGRPPKRAEPEIRWTRSALAVAEALLCGSPATVSSIQEVTDLSTGSCTRALGTLGQLGLLESDAGRGPTSGRRVADASALLAAYVRADEARRPTVELVVGALWRDAVDGVRGVGERWASNNIDWVATGAVAGAVLAPHLTTVESAVVYVDTKTMIGLEAAARVAGLEPIEGGRLTMRPFPTVTTQRLASDSNGLRVAPWPRVYVDLQGLGVRGEEAAEHLREVIERAG